MGVAFVDLPKTIKSGWRAFGDRLMFLATEDLRRSLADITQLEAPMYNLQLLVQHQRQ